MASFQVEHLLVLNKHAEQLIAALYKVNKDFNESHDKCLQTKEIEAVVKAIRDNKSVDTEKFPHLQAPALKKYGQLLREPFSVLWHFSCFQTSALNTLRDALNESKNFDFTWNYIYVLPVLKLFSNYFKLNIMVNMIDNLERIATVYGYCVHRTQKKPDENVRIVIHCLKEKQGYKKLDSELQQVHDKFFDLYKGIFPILSKIINAGSTYTWKELNINDNPNPLDEERLFCKPEYLVMINFRLLIECFIMMSIIFPNSLQTDKQFFDLFFTINGYSSCISLYADMNADTKKLVIDFEKFKGKKISELIKPEEMAAKREELSPIRTYRQRKLIMIMSEYSSAVEYDQKLLMTKLSIIEAILGLANYEILTELQTWTNDSSHSIIGLISAASDLMVLINKNKENISRFLVFNFREYDGPFLDSMIHSFTIPQQSFYRLSQVVQAFREINIEEFDSGIQYDLSGLYITLIREMSSFNTYSRSRGVVHLSPLFSMISAIWTRLNQYINIDSHFLDIFCIDTLWIYNPIFLQLVKTKNIKYLSKVSSFFQVAHFYSSNINAFLCVPNYKETIKSFVSDLMRDVLKTIQSHAQSLQTMDLKDLFLQTKCNIAQAHRPQPNKLQKPTQILEMPIGQESLLASRSLLKPIQNKVEAMNGIISKITQICSINVFGENRDILNELREGLRRIFTDFYKAITFKTPFQADDQLRITKFIFENLMSAAQMNYPQEYTTCMGQLCKVEILRIDNAIVYQDSIGQIPQQFSTIYRNFLSNLLQKSYFSNTSQKFVSTDPSGDTLPSLLASPSAIRIIYELLGYKGIAFVDIIAADMFVGIANAIASKINDSKLFDHVNKAIKDGDPKDKTAWIKVIATPESFDGPSGQLNQLFCHLGAIERFRKLIRQSIDVHSKEFSFLSSFSTQNDEVLSSRLAKCYFVEIAKRENFAQFVGCLFASPWWAETKYNPIHNCFANNGHLFTLGLESIFVCIAQQNKQFNAKTEIANLLTTAYISIGVGGQLIAIKNKKARWMRSPMLLLFDHFVQNSTFIDYSILEQIIPYQTLRHIYTVILTKSLTNEQQVPQQSQQTQQK